ncbi:hypothetical protein ACFL2O_08805 [Thermodesulfobacteriota bacterium]
MRECFEFYETSIEVESDSEELLEELRRDFSFFSIDNCKNNFEIKIVLVLASPPYDGLPPVKASFSTPRNICFQNSNVSYIDYFGKGLAVYDRKQKACSIYGNDFDLVHEIAYLFILSIVGEYLDSMGLHRVHALGVSSDNRGILLLLPSGGGKSTMALKLLSQPGYMLLGEDTPIIDRKGRILPFPLRLGVRPDHETVGVPDKYIRTVNRMEFDPKKLIDIDYFRERIGTAVKPGIILVGQRNLGEVSEIIPISRLKAFKALLKYAVVGLGIYQGLEFMLERGTWELLGKAGVVSSRLYNSIRLLSQSKCYRFVLGRDIEKNCETLLEFAKSV